MSWAILALVACGSGPAAPDPTPAATPATPPSATSPPVEDTASTTPLDPTTPDDPAPIWVPAPGTTWQWQLQGAIDTSVDVVAYDVDLFDTPSAVRDELHAAGRIVICYLSAGSYEDWRPDAGAFDPAAIGEPLDGWPGEWWVDIRSDSVRDVMEARLELARDLGCDAVEPDNVDGYANVSGFPLTRADQLDYNSFLAVEAHARGLSVGLKNAVELVPELVDDFDWALNEECLAWDECGRLAPFLDQGKAVLHVEYVDQPDQGPDALAAICDEPTIAGFSTLVKTWELDAWLLTCGA